ncbi:MAG: hypothetical protein WHX52_22960, partial [Anaerolineae bacterium]
GLFPDVRAAAEAMTRTLPEPFMPDDARHTFYSRVYTQVYRALFPAVQPYVQRLTALTDCVETVARVGNSRQGRVANLRYKTGDFIEEKQCD